MSQTFADVRPFRLKNDKPIAVGLRVMVTDDGSIREAQENEEDIGTVVSLSEVMTPGHVSQVFRAGSPIVENADPPRTQAVQLRNSRRPSRMVCLTAVEVGQAVYAAEAGQVTAFHGGLPFQINGGRRLGIAITAVLHPTFSSFHGDLTEPQPLDELGRPLGSFVEVERQG